MARALGRVDLHNQSNGCSPRSPHESSTIEGSGSQIDVIIDVITSCPRTWLISYEIKSNNLRSHRRPPNCGGGGVGLDRSAFCKAAFSALLALLTLRRAT